MGDETTERRENVEVRLNDDGTVDELLVYANGKCVYHMEQMSDGCYWMAAYGDNGATVHVNLFAGMAVYENDLTGRQKRQPCIEGRREWDEPPALAGGPPTKGTT